MPSLLVADIGGTNGRFALVPYTGSNDLLPCEDVRSFNTGTFSGFAEMLDAYVSSLSQRPEYACFGIAGPIADGTAHMTNVGFSVSSADIARRFGLKSVCLINDLQAMASAVLHLRPYETRELQKGQERRTGAISVVGIGTGFGAAMLAPTQDGWVITPTEAGHQGFAPTDDLQVEIVKRLRKTLPRVSIETLLSGPGLARIHATLCEIHGERKEQLTPEEICNRAILGGKTTYAAALTEFFSMLGSVAGDIALAHGATGGVYLGGGVLNKNANLLPRDEFIKRFHAKGPMEQYARNIPVHVIRSEQAALRGAAHWILERVLSKA
jgi:glucokinase